MKKDIWKRLITDSQEKDLSHVIRRNLVIPLELDKVISLIGVRRSGKTYLLYSLIQQLRKKTDPTSIVFINLEDDRLFPLQLTDMDELVESYYELFPHQRNSTVHFLFDEIQNVPEWEKFIRRLHDTEKCRIFITGSSARFLSKEIATSMRGRTISFEVFPLSFEEYLQFRDIPIQIHSSRTVARIRNALTEYITKGGFPETVGLNDDLSQKILHEYLGLIIYHDVIERYNVANTFLLKFLVKYCFANISTLLSFNKLYNDFRSQGLQLSKNTLYEYVSYLEDAYAVFSIPVYASSVREGMRNPKKIYSIDHAFKRIVDIPFSPDLGRIYENIVFLELRRKGKELFYIKGKQEVDFLFMEDGTPHLINVCYDIEHPETKEREINGLIEAVKRLKVSEAVLITAEKEETIKVGNKIVQIVPLWKWLLVDKF